MIFLLSCTPAQTEESLPHATTGASSTQQVQEHKLPTREYLPQYVREQWRLAKLERFMREPVNADQRVFFTTKVDKDTNASYSLKDTRDGYLYNGHPIPVPSL